MNTLLRFILYPPLLVAYLIIEVFAAMLAYTYLNINHFDIFGSLARLSGELLDLFEAQLKTFYPELANNAYATILGEMNPKSVLLLILGLTVSTVVRLMIWSFHKGADKMRPEDEARARTDAA